jgi:hypothetical protein
LAGNIARLQIFSFAHNQNSIKMKIWFWVIFGRGI